MNVKTIYFDADPEGSRIEVGECGVTRIEETTECGHMANITIYNVYKSDELFMKVYPHACTIMYATKENNHKRGEKG